MTLDGRDGRGFGRDGLGRSRGRDNQRQSRAPVGRTTAKNHVGLEEATADNVFTYKEKGAADTTQNTLNMLVKHIGTLYDQYIAN